MMLHIPDVLTAAEVAQARSLMAQAAWQSGQLSAGRQAAQVKNNQQLDEHGPQSAALQALVQQALTRHATFMSAALPARVLPPRFNRYEAPGQAYGDHVDAAIMSSASGQRLRTDVSCTLFLSDPDDYDGGELVVADTYGEHEVKLPAGDLIAYSSTSLHRVEPVTRGARQCAFFWVQSVIRDDARRGMLFELDNTIQRLRATLGDSAEVLSLTTHYHNLLRQWADL